VIGVLNVERSGYTVATREAGQKGRLVREASLDWILGKGMDRVGQSRVMLKR